MPKKVAAVGPQKLTEEALEHLAKEFMNHPKGRPPRAIAAKIKQLRNKNPNMALDIQLFFDEWVSNGGNAVQAVKKLRPGLTKYSYGQLGTYYLKKAKDLGLVRLYLEERGFGLGGFLDHALDKMKTSKDTAFFDRLMKMAGYEDFLPGKSTGGGQTINIVNTQNKQAEEFGFIDGEIIDEKSEEI